MADLRAVAAVMNHTATINLLQEEPELSRDLDPRRAKLAARGATARVVSLPKGLFSAGDVLSRERGALGMLVLDGLLLRGVSATAQPSLEVLGRGDLVRLEAESDPYATVATLVGWWALRPARLAVLDAGLTSRMAEYPEVIAELAGRLWRRSAASSLELAIVQEPCLWRRLHGMLWHLANRFGRREGDGVILPVPLCHTLLSWLVVASRPAVSRALKQLQRTHLIESRPDGSWQLSLQPPKCFGELAAVSAQPVAA